MNSSPRRVGLFGLVSILMIALTGCGGGPDRSGSSGFADGDSRAVAAAATQMDGVIDDELHDLAAALDLDVTASNPATGLCDERDDKDGVLLNDVIYFDWPGGDNRTREGGATVVRVLEDAGWTMHGRSKVPADWSDEEAYRPRMTATKADVVLQVLISPAEIHAIAQTTCVETTPEFAKEYVGNRPDAIVWK